MLKDMEIEAKSWMIGEPNREELQADAPGYFVPGVPMVDFIPVEESLERLPPLFIECRVHSGPLSATPGASAGPSAMASSRAPTSPQGHPVFLEAFDDARSQFSFPCRPEEADAVFDAIKTAFFKEGVCSIGDMLEEFRRTPPVRMLVSVVLPEVGTALIEGVNLEDDVCPVDPDWEGPRLDFPSKVQVVAEALLALEAATRQVAEGRDYLWKDEIQEKFRRWPRSAPRPLHWQSGSARTELSESILLALPAIEGGGECPYCGRLIEDGIFLPSRDALACR